MKFVLPVRFEIIFYVFLGVFKNNSKFKPTMFFIGTETNLIQPTYIITTIKALFYFYNNLINKLSKEIVMMIC